MEYSSEQLYMKAVRLCKQWHKEGKSFGSKELAETSGITPEEAYMIYVDEYDCEPNYE